MSRPEAKMRPGEPWGAISWGIDGAAETQPPEMIRKLMRQNPEGSLNPSQNVILHCEETDEKVDLGPLHLARDGLILYGSSRSRKSGSKMEKTDAGFVIHCQTQEEAGKIRLIVAHSIAGLLSFLPEEILQEK